jgi:hypothetical protein
VSTITPVSGRVATSIALASMGGANTSSALASRGGGGPASSLGSGHAELEYGTGSSLPNVVEQTKWLLGCLQSRSASCAVKQ